MPSKNIITFLFILYLLNSFQLKSQSPVPDPIYRLYESVVSENEGMGEEEYEEFLHLYHAKRNINSISEEELSRLHFLTSFQVFRFLEYRENYGEILSFNELLLIPGFHPDLVQLMAEAFSYGITGKSSIGSIKAKPITSSILIRAKQQFPVSKAYTEQEGKSSIEGLPFSRLLKWKIEKAKVLQAGISLESDKGEVIRFTDHQKGFNFSSGYLVYRPPGIQGLKIHLGDYKLDAGEGLVYNARFLGKSLYAESNRKLAAFRKYSSTAEFGFFRGAGFEYHHKQIRILLYRSALTNSVSTHYSDDSIYHFKTLNFLTLLDQKSQEEYWKNLRETNSGMLLSISRDHVHAGLTFRRTKFSIPFQYSEKRPGGKPGIDSDFFWLSGYYSFTWKKMFLSGEFARAGFRAIAMQQIFACEPQPELSFQMNARYYSKNYFLPHSRVFSERGRPQNESGIFFLFNLHPKPKLKLRFYLDFYRLPYPYPYFPLAIKGRDYRMEVHLKPQPNSLIRLGIQNEVQNGLNKTIHSMDYAANEMSKYRFFLVAETSATDHIKLRFRLESKQSNQSSPGYMIYQEYSQRFPSLHLSANLRYSIFDIADWDDRIYSWEHDLLYSFYSSVYYKQGQRLFINLSYSIRSKAKIGFKFGLTNYGCSRKVGNGIYEREGSSFYDLKLQLILDLN